MDETGFPQNPSWSHPAGARRPATPRGRRPGSRNTAGDPRNMAGDPWGSPAALREKAPALEDRSWISVWFGLGRSPVRTPPAPLSGGITCNGVGQVSK